MNKEKIFSPQERYLLRLQKLSEVDPEINRLMPDISVGLKASASGLSIEHTIDTILKDYSDRFAFGERKYEIIHDSKAGRYIRNYLSEYSMLTYGEFRSHIHALANTWRYSSDYQVSPDEFVCIIGFASVDYMVIDTACAYAHAVSVPMQSTISTVDLNEILNNINPAVIAVTIEKLELVADKASLQTCVRTIIVFDYDDRDEENLAQLRAVQKQLEYKNITIQLISLKDLIKFGQDYTFTFLPQHKEGDNHMGAIIHSSGSTGRPKGAIFRDKANRQLWLKRVKETFPSVTILFAPLNHSMGRALFQGTLGMGGTVYITLKSDMSTLFEDIRLARPTFIAFFPRVLELIYQYYQNEAIRRIELGAENQDDIKQQVKLEMRSTFLGDRLGAATVGSAPLSPAIKDFIVDCFDILFIECYSSTEAGVGAIAINGRIQRPPVLEYKLVDAPELGYHADDKPYPRGELYYKCKFGVSEYYNKPEITATLFDKDGFFRTGDIVEERTKDYIRVIGRRSDVLKLSQGEFIALGSLTSTFESNSRLIKQIYIYGNSLQSYLLAVIVPDLEAATSKLNENYSESTLRNAIQNELESIASSNHLKSFEVPRDFIIEYEPFTQKNGLLSSLNKRLRPALQKKYAKRLEAIYQSHQHKQHDELVILQDSHSTPNTLEKLNKILALTLHQSHSEQSELKSFTQLGGDSIAAVLFSISIEKIFGVVIPADVILNPVNTLQYFSQLIDSHLNDEKKLPNINLIHKMNSKILHKSDLELSAFLGSDCLSKAADLQKTTGKSITILLTGANGFLGRNVCLQYLEKLTLTNGKLICLVRAKDDISAKLRLDAVFKALDTEVYELYQNRAKNHLEVVAGDFSESYLGLSRQTFNRIGKEVDRIVHLGALVNHRLAYQHLFKTNVIGVAEIIRLALTTRMKPIDFISSKGVISLTDAKSGRGEDAQLLDSVQINDQYGNGYMTSKWAGECLLHQANKRFAVPVNTLRSGMMLAHSSIKKMINPSDVLTRLIYTIINTQLAPTSFYKFTNDKVLHHYDGLPVDITAATVVGASETNYINYSVYHIHNYHYSDGASLDSFVDWIESAGYSLKRIQGYDQWLRKITCALDQLPMEKRAFSAINVLDAYAKPRDITRVILCDRFKQLFLQLSVGHSIPHLNEAYIHKLLKDMQQLDLISIPEK